MAVSNILVWIVPLDCEDLLMGEEEFQDVSNVGGDDDDNRFDMTVGCL